MTWQTTSRIEGSAHVADRFSDSDAGGAGYSPWGAISEDDSGVRQRCGSSMDSPASGMAHGGWFRSYDSDWDQYGKSDSDSVNEHVPADGHDTDTDSDTDGEEDGAQGKNRHPEDVPGMASFIMNQKSLADKAPGAQQNSFAHRTIELPYPAHVRIVQLCVVLLTGLLTAGIPFGLPALRQVMIESSIYDDLCEGRSSDSKRVGCSAQEARLAILQVSGWVSWMIGGWLAARSVERLGPRATGIVGSGVVMAGAVLLATIMPEEDGSFLLPLWMRFYNIPVVIMSVGSVFVLLACLHYVRLFPKRTSLLHSLVFLSHDMSSLLFYVFYECRKLLSLQGLLCVYAGVMGCQMLLWFLVFSPDNIPTMRFTVTTWHQRPLMVDLSRQRHISSPYFLLALTLSVVVLLKLFFYMSTFQVQLRLLLTPTTRHIAPEDFVYHADDVHLTSNPSNFLTPQDSPHFTSPSLSYSDDMREGQRAPVRPTQSFSYVPFFAEQPGEGSSTVLALRQFTYNPMQPELFLTDLQEMLYFLLPIASLMTIFWMRAAMADRKLSTALHLSLVSLIVWGLVQNVFSVKTQALAAISFPIFRSIFTAAIYEYCERIFGCQHFHFTFWFLWACVGLVLAVLLLPLVYFAINHFEQYGLFEHINRALNVTLVVGLTVVWILKCNHL